MKKSIGLCVLFFVIVPLISSCISSAPSFADPQANIEVPRVRGGNVVKLTAMDAQNIVADYFGYDMTLYNNTLELRQLDNSESEIFPDLENDLIEAGFRLDSDILYPLWYKGDTYAAYVFIDGINQDTLDFLRRSYGIQDLEVGKTLLLTYAFDRSAPLPNPTLTVAAAMWEAERTAQAVEEANQAATLIAERTLQAEEISQQSTQTALEIQVQSTQAAIDAQNLAEQIALQSELEHQNAVATALALQPILDAMGTEFDGEGTLPAGMKVVREDPTRWDLTTRPGWLHITGRYSKFSDDNWIPKNIFLLPITYNNLSVVIRVDADMEKSNQSVGMGLTPNDYRSEGYNVELGLGLDSNQGRIAYAWACGSDSCWWSNDFSFSDPIQFNGPVYLRMDIQGNVYTFYYGENGIDWIYLGEASGFSAGDKLYLMAGGGSSSYREIEFDAYFDLLRFEAIMPE